MPAVAVGGVLAVVAALLALLLLYGAKLFGEGLASLFSTDVPVLSTIHRGLILAANAAQAAMSWIMADAVRPVINFILAPAYAFWNFLDAVYLFTRTMASSWVWLLNTAIPQVIRKVEGYAHTLVVAARHYALALYHDAIKYAHGLVVAARSYALALYHDATKYAHALVVAARSYALALYHDATKYADSLYHRAIAYADKVVKVQLGAITAELDTVTKAVTANLQLAERYADSTIAGTVKALTGQITTATAAVITYVDVDALRGLTAAWDGVIDDVVTLEGIIGTDLPDIGAAVRAIPRAVPADLADALTVVGAISIPMLRYMARCGIPNCRNLSALGRDLQELFSVLEGAGFLALIGFIVANPGRASQEANDVLTPLASGLVGAARDLIGV